MSLKSLITFVPGITACNEKLIMHYYQKFAIMHYHKKFAHFFVKTTRNSKSTVTSLSTLGNVTQIDMLEWKIDFECLGPKG